MNVFLFGILLFSLLFAFQVFTNRLHDFPIERPIFLLRYGTQCLNKLRWKADGDFDFSLLLHAVIIQLFRRHVKQQRGPPYPRLKTRVCGGPIIKRQHRDFCFKTARPYAERYQHICVEDLNLLNMMRQNPYLRMDIRDAAWSTFLTILEDKAERAGHQVIRVPAFFTSQRCSGCGAMAPKSLSVRTHVCPACGYVEDRDVNAARNILRAGAPPSGNEHPTG